MREISIALCEDDERVLQYLHRILENALRYPNTQLNFSLFTNAAQLLQSISEKSDYDVFFLDIEMPHMDGIELCHRIRKIKHDALVIFISNKEELVFQTFEVQPFRFIRKNHFASELPSLVEALHHKLFANQQTLIRITPDSSKTIYSFDPAQLIYIEVKGKYCNFVSTRSTHTIRYRISDLVKILELHGFVQIHRSYLVNCRYIYSISPNDVTLDTQKVLPLGRNRSKDVKEFFMQYSQKEWQNAPNLYRNRLYPHILYSCLHPILYFLNIVQESIEISSNS